MENETQSLSNENLEKPQPASVNQAPESPLFNQNWFYIGIGVASIVGISYLVFRTPAKMEYKFVPKKQPLKKTPRSTNLSPVPEEPEKVKSEPKFELNSF